jgi:hypothetical protein
MIVSLLLLIGNSTGCLSANPPKGCPEADCKVGDERPSCQLDQALQRQMTEAWQAETGVKGHGAMAKTGSAERSQKPKQAPLKSARKPYSRLSRCSLGAVLFGGGLWLALEKNWLQRGVGAISALAGLWVCGSAR